MSFIAAHDPQLVRLADAIAQRVGPQRFHVWFNNSTRLDLKGDGLEIAVPNDFISEWITTHFARPIQEAAHEVLGGPLSVRFSVMPQLFTSDADGAKVAAGGRAADAPRRGGHERGSAGAHAASAASMAEDGVVYPARLASMPASASARRLAAHSAGDGSSAAVAAAARAAAASAVGVAPARPRGLDVAIEAFDRGGTVAMPTSRDPSGAMREAFGAARELAANPLASRPRLRHDLASFVVGHGNQLAYNTAFYVAEFPGAQYNPLFIHGPCGLGKTHLLQGICKKFAVHHPTKRWAYLTGEEFTNEFLTALRNNKLDVFRRKVRELDLLVIDDVHFLGGKKATQEEFLHTFNAIEAMGRQVVLASDNHPKMIEAFGESLTNRFVSGMVVRVDPPNFSTRCDILRNLAARANVPLSEEVTGWVARRVTQNVRELEGAITRIGAHAKLGDRAPDVQMAQEALGDLDRALVAPVKPENILDAVCAYFGFERTDLMSGRRQRTISLARSVAMFLVRKTAKLSFPEIGHRMGKRNHSTVISACRRIERAAAKNEKLVWTSAVGEREEEALELIQRLEEQCRAMN